MKTYLMILATVMMMMVQPTFARETKASAGATKVHGYTKKDGTKVAGYTRHGQKAVEVKGYTRRDGKKVKTYSRKTAAKH